MEGIHTTDKVHVNHPHSQIIQPHPPIHTPRHHLMPHHVQTTHTILALLQHLDGFRGLALAIPQPHGSIKTACPSANQRPGSPKRAPSRQEQTHRSPRRCRPHPQTRHNSPVQNAHSTSSASSPSRHPTRTLACPPRHWRSARYHPSPPNRGLRSRGRSRSARARIWVRRPRL